MVSSRINKFRFGVVYCGEMDNLCTLKIGREKRQYQRLHILEFDSDRKRMSVIVQFPDESIWLLCKGAESTILPRCVHGAIAETENHIKDYALVRKNGTVFQKLIARTIISYYTGM